MYHGASYVVRFYWLERHDHLSMRGSVPDIGRMHAIAAVCHLLLDGRGEKIVKRHFVEQHHNSGRLRKMPHHLTLRNATEEESAFCGKDKDGVVIESFNRVLFNVYR